MPRLFIAVGSTRKPKLNAVREALDEIGDLFARGSEIIPVEVNSGVTHTPSSREEMMRGARQRAEAVRTIAIAQNEPWHYFVGLEGGLDSVEENGIRRVFLESWAYVSDRERSFFGRSGAVEIPAALAEDVLVHSIELSVAIDRFAEQTGIRDAQGAWGVLSANKITRQQAFRVAVMSAFAPFYNERMYRKSVAQT